MNKFKLELANKTDWNTQDLRKFFVACYKREGFAQRRKRVEVVTAKYRYGKSHIGGLASVGGNWIRMKLPLPENVGGVLNLEVLAQVFAHEMQHNAGLRHDVMAHHSVFDYAEWVKNFSIRCDVKVVPFDNVGKVAELNEKIGLARIEYEARRISYRKYLGLIQRRNRLSEQKFRVVSEPKPKVDLVGKRRSNAEVKLKQARSRLKRYENIVKRWEKKLRYYEKRASTGLSVEKSI